MAHVSNPMKAASTDRRQPPITGRRLRDIPRRLLLPGLALMWIVGCSSDDGITEPGSITMTITSDSATVYRGGGAHTFGVAFSGSVNFTGPVNVAVTGAPTGVTVGISSVRDSAGIRVVTITLDASASATEGRHNLIVRVSASGFAEATQPLLLNVAEALVRCGLPDGQCEELAETATASSEYTDYEWSAKQATGHPAIIGCSDDARAWASLTSNGVDWLELVYPMNLRPAEIHVYENYAVSSIVRVEVKDAAGTYREVYTAVPGVYVCPRILKIPVTGISTKLRVVRLSFDQRNLNDWNEIDAVKLIGFP